MNLYYQAKVEIISHYRAFSRGIWHLRELFDFLNKLLTKCTRKHSCICGIRAAGIYVKNSIPPCARSLRNNDAAEMWARMNETFSSQLLHHSTCDNHRYPKLTTDFSASRETVSSFKPTVHDCRPVSIANLSCQRLLLQLVDIEKLVHLRFYIGTRLFDYIKYI